MPEVIDWPQGESDAVVTRALHHLREGRLVVLPTESVYMIVAAAAAPGALPALDQAAGPGTPLTLLLGQAMEIYDWLPSFRGVGIRLARRFWPGPLTLVSGACLDQGLFPRLPSALQNRLAPERQLSLSLPYHDAARHIAQRLGTPLLAAPTSWIAPEQMEASLGEKIALVIKDGRTSFAQPGTAVEVEGRKWELRRAGAIPAEEIAEAAPCRVVFVCTGNTCRSPLAAGICRKLLADRLGCAAQDLPQHGFIVESAGVAATMGFPATPEAVAAAGELGADLTGHGSQPLTIELLLHADRLFAMTTSHLRMLYGVRGVTPRLLAPGGEDVDDPIGGTPERYRECAGQIKSYLEGLLPELCEC